VKVYGTAVTKNVKDLNDITHKFVSELRTQADKRIDEQDWGFFFIYLKDNGVVAEDDDLMPGVIIVGRSIKGE